jgi:hypothetical protein
MTQKISYSDIIQQGKNELQNKKKNDELKNKKRKYESIIAFEIKNWEFTEFVPDVIQNFEYIPIDETLVELCCRQERMEGIFKCIFCNRLYNILAMVELHEMTHVKREQCEKFLVQCKICKKKFGSDSKIVPIFWTILNLRVHMLNDHRDSWDRKRKWI